jgi:hypothetical protein
MRRRGSLFKFRKEILQCQATGGADFPEFGHYFFLGVLLARPIEEFGGD